MRFGWKYSALGAGWLQPFEDAPDAGSSGGGADLSDAGDGSQPSGDAVADGDQVDPSLAAGDDAAREETLEDLLTDDEEDHVARPDAERIKALAKKNRKIRKQLAKALPMMKRLEGVDLDDLVMSKRQLMQLSDTINRNPKLRALFQGEQEPEPERRTPAAEAREEQFDESSLPFDPNESPTNRYFANLAKELFESKQAQRRLQARLDGNDTRESQRNEGQVREHWKSTIVTAADQIKSPAVQRLFKDALAAQFRDPEVRKRYTPQQLVGHYLRGLQEEGLITQAEARATAAAAARTVPAGTGKPPVRTAATQARIAEQNKNLPRTAAVTGSPAPAQNQRPTLAMLRKQISNSLRSA